MMFLHARNVNVLYRDGLAALRANGVRESSRAGDVLVAPWPVMSIYERPQERVLFDERRDANPFFHLFESLWMLAGRSDAAWLQRFVRDFDRYAERDGHIHGAYGRRWRSWWEIEQLEMAIARLRRDPADRRSVICMWDPIYDMLGPEGSDEETGALIWPTEPRDLPCNTHIYLRVRTPDPGYRRLGIDEKNPNPDGSDYHLMNILDSEAAKSAVLDMTVCCRSNDIVWGAYGANAVHFSVLQEYLAARMGVNMGVLHQLSHNWHAYVPVLEKVTWEGEPPDSDLYSRKDAGVLIAPSPMIIVPSEFMRDLSRFMEFPESETAVYANSWFSRTAHPMWMAHAAHKLGQADAALRWAGDIQARDWRVAAQQWISRRTT